MTTNDPLLSFPSESDTTVVTRRQEDRFVFSTQAGPQASKTEAGALDALRAQVREAEQAITESAAEGAALRTALEPLRELAAQLAGEYGRIQEASREAERRSAAAVEMLQEIEKRLGPLTVLQDLGKNSDERFEVLKAFGAEVTVQSEALHGQKETIEQAVAEASRVAHLVGTMETRIATLKDGDQLLERIEAKLGRLEQVAAETTGQLEQTEQLKDTLGRELARFEGDVRVQLRETEQAITQSVAEGAALRTGLEPLRELAAQLAGEYGRIQEAAREADGRSAAAVEMVQEIEKRVGPLAVLDQRFEVLKAFGAEVTVQSEALHGQKETIEQAVAEASRVAHLVGTMETRIATLKDGDQLLERIEAKLGRLEQVAAETTGQLEQTEQLKDTLGRELARFEGDVRVQLRETEQAITQSAAEGAALRTGLAPLRELAAQLAGEYGRIQEAAREADGRSAAAVAMVDEIEKRVGPFAVLQDLSRHSDERFEVLKAFGAEVAAQGEALHGQKEMIEQAVAEASRVAHLLGAMDTRIATLKDGEQLLERIEAKLGRLEQVGAETTTQLEQKEQLRDELGRDLVRFERDVQLLTESARRRVEDVVNQTKQFFEAFDSPLFTSRALRREGSTAMTEMEVRTVDLKVAAPSPGVSRKESRGLRTQHMMRLMRQSGAAVALSVFVVMTVMLLVRSLGKTAQIDGQALPAQTHSFLAVSVPVLSGTTLSSGVTIAPTITTERPSLGPSPLQPAAQSPQYVGTLAIQSTPDGAAVFVDRQQVGETPVRLSRMRAGAHAVWIERDGYQRWTAAVNVPADKLTRLSATLDAKVGR